MLLLLLLFLLLFITVVEALGWLFLCCCCYIFWSDFKNWVYLCLCLYLFLYIIASRVVVCCGSSVFFCFLLFFDSCIIIIRIIFFNCFFRVSLKSIKLHVAVVVAFLKVSFDDWLNYWVKSINYLSFSDSVAIGFLLPIGMAALILSAISVNLLRTKSK